MDRSRYQRIKELCLAAEQLDPLDVDKFLSRESGDDETLIAEVRSLLASSVRTGEVLHGPAHQALGVDRSVEISAELHSGPDDQAAWDRFLTQLASRGPAHTRYEFQGEIARGGMGVIHRVYDNDVRRHLAMKVILGRDDTGTTGRAPDADQKSLGRFLEEAQVTGQLDHPGIVPVHELGLDRDGQVYFTMKLVRGEDLRSVFDRVHDPTDESWNQTRALSVLLRVCEAMAYAHSKGVVHRDLKPTNVMVGTYGETYVMDWGLAKVKGLEDRKDLRIRPAMSSIGVVSERKDTALDTPDSSLVTMDGDVVGTPSYMAPEQAQGRVAEIGAPADVYAVGAMLYHLLAGRVPYTEPGDHISPRSIVAQVTQGPPMTLAELAPDAPAELVAIVARTMERKIENRYPEMTALARDLRAFLEHRVVTAYESGAIAELKKWVVRNKGITATALAAVVIIAALTGWFVWNVKLSEQKAIANEKRADSSSAELGRLSDAKILSDLKTEMHGLWPAHPAQVPAMKDWLTRARRLLDGLPAHQQTLQDLRARGLPQIAPTEALIQGEQPLEFEDEKLAWWHETLVRLVSGLVAFSAADPYSETLESVENRLAFAETIRKHSITYYQDEWEDAIASISDPDECPQYKGLEIREQLGLVPLGRDPDSGLWEFWHVQTGEKPQRDDQGRLTKSDGMGLVFVLIPGGSFWMGAQQTDPEGRNYDPQAEPEESDGGGHPVEVTLDAYFLSKFEMTQGQWSAFTGQNTSFWFATYPASSGPLHPIEQVSWIEGNRELSRLGLELPTEAQWEHACRAGTDTPWHCGREAASLAEFANIADASYGRKIANARDFEEFDDGLVLPAPLGSLKANGFGLFDMHGNVWEWCRDVYSSYDLPADPGDGERHAQDASIHIARGGCCLLYAHYARSAIRRKLTPVNRDSDLGLRPARAIDT